MFLQEIRFVFSIPNADFIRNDSLIMKSKRLLFLFLSSLIGVSLSSCGSSQTSEEQKTSSSEPAENSIEESSKEETSSIPSSSPLEGEPIRPKIIKDIPLSSLRFEKLFDESSYALLGVTKDDYSSLDGMRLVVPNEYNGLPVTRIAREAFLDCSFLKSVSISDNVTFIGENAFSSCPILEEIVISKGVIAIGDNFVSSCRVLKSIQVDEKSERFCSLDGVLFSKDKNKLLVYPAGKKDSSFVIPQFVKTIKAGAFSGAESLTSLRTFESHDKFASYDGVIYSKNGDEIIVFPPGKGLEGSKAFEIRDGTKSIASNAFESARFLKEVVIPHGIKKIGKMSFANCLSLLSILIPSTTRMIGQLAFASCPNLTSIFVYEESKFYSSNDGILYSKDRERLICCPSGKELGDDFKKDPPFTIPSNVREIEEYAFYGSASLSKVVIPETVNVIGSYAFKDCASLQKVTISNKVKSVRASIFYGCDLLKEIVSTGDERPKGWNPAWRNGCDAMSPFKNEK